MIRRVPIPLLASAFGHVGAGVGLAAWCGLHPIPPRLEIPQGATLGFPTFVVESEPLAADAPPAPPIPDQAAPEPQPDPEPHPNHEPAIQPQPEVAATPEPSPVPPPAVAEDPVEPDPVATDTDPSPIQPAAPPIDDNTRQLVLTRALDGIDAAQHRLDALADAARHAFRAVASHVPRLPRTTPPATPPATQPPTVSPSTAGASSPGGSNHGVSRQPSLATSNRPPVYPDEARRKRQTGTALIHVTIETDSVISSLSLARSSGFPLLDNAALDAVRAWHFIPAIEDGDPIRCSLDVPISFVLRH